MAKKPFVTGANINVMTLAKLIVEHHHVHLKLTWDATQLYGTLPDEVKDMSRSCGQILQTLTAYLVDEKTIGFKVATVTDTNEEAIVLLQKESPW